MTPSDRRPFLEIVIGFAELKGRALSAPALELYWRAMQAWTIEDFRAGAEQLVRTSKFMPGPDEFEALRRAGRETPAEAWARAVEHARSSAYRRGPLGDRQVDLLVAGLGGYVAIAMSDESALHFLERRFTEHFETLQDVDATRDAVPEIAYSGPRKLGHGPNTLRPLSLPASLAK